MQNHAPQATEVFDDLIAALTEIKEQYLLNTERFDTPLDVIEGFRYVGQALSGASEMFFEADPKRPRFVSIVDPGRKFQGDNPDAIYHFARIRGDRSYLLSGTIGQECYTSFTIHGAADDGGMAGPLLGDVNDKDFEVGEDGYYELILSADEPREGGNWIKLEPEAHAVIVRSYFALEPSVQNDPNVAVKIAIEALPGKNGELPPSPPPLNDGTFAARMAEGVAFLRQVTVGQNMPGSASGVPFVSDIPNDVATPFSFRDSGMPVPGAADIFYSMGRWDFAEDEALVMTGEIPEGPFANVMLWNQHMQTVDYRNRRSSLNQNQIAFEPDGSYRIVIAHSDPGQPNWLDVEGHTRGTIFWRFLLPETDPVKPHIERVKLADLS